MRKYGKILKVLGHDIMKLDKCLNDLKAFGLLLHHLKNS